MSKESEMSEEYDITETDTIQIKDDRPLYGSKEWDEFIKSEFEEDELIDGNPLCRGLRRVACKHLGDIIYSAPKNVYVQGEANYPGKVTVVYEIQINWMNTGEVRTFGDVSEVWHGNTDDLFLAHPSATACTKAEGRVLRKALMVNCLAAEELPKKDVINAVRESKAKNPTPTDGNINGRDPITTPQKNFINKLAKQLDINIMKYVNMGSGTYEDINQISKQSAIKMIQELNKYQQDGESIPEDVRGYSDIDI